MQTVKLNHRQAMKVANEAILAKRRGDIKAATLLFSQAYELGKKLLILYY